MPRKDQEKPPQAPERSSLTEANRSQELSRLVDPDGKINKNIDRSCRKHILTNRKDLEAVRRVPKSGSKSTKGGRRKFKVNFGKIFEEPQKVFAVKAIKEAYSDVSVTLTSGDGV